MKPAAYDMSDRKAIKPAAASKPASYFMLFYHFSLHHRNTNKERIYFLARIIKISYKRTNLEIIIIKIRASLIFLSSSMIVVP